MTAKRKNTRVGLAYFAIGHEPSPRNKVVRRKPDLDDAPLTEEELASMRPAREVLPESFFEAVKRERNLGGRPRLDNPKKLISLRIDQDVIDKYKATGEGWQSRINEALRKSVGI